MLIALWIQKQALSIKTSTIGVGEEECERADAEKHNDFDLSRVSFLSFIVALNLIVRFLSNSLPLPPSVPYLSAAVPGVQCIRIGVMEDNFGFGHVFITIQCKRISCNAIHLDCRKDLGMSRTLS